MQAWHTPQRREVSGLMADLLFVLVTIVSFGILVAFVYACAKL
jgi:hypothetical protein